MNRRGCGPDGTGGSAAHAAEPAPSATAVVHIHIHIADLTRELGTAFSLYEDR
jgi:hypothetical protein